MNQSNKKSISFLIILTLLAQAACTTSYRSNSKPAGPKKEDKSPTQKTEEVDLSFQAKDVRSLIQRLGDKSLPLTEKEKNLLMTVLLVNFAENDEDWQRTLALEDLLAAHHWDRTAGMIFIPAGFIASATAIGRLRDLGGRIKNLSHSRAVQTADLMRAKDAIKAELEIALKDQGASGEAFARVLKGSGFEGSVGTIEKLRLSRDPSLLEAFMKEALAPKLVKIQRSTRWNIVKGGIRSLTMGALAGVLLRSGQVFLQIDQNQSEAWKSELQLHKGTILARNKILMTLAQLAGFLEMPMAESRDAHLADILDGSVKMNAVQLYLFSREIDAQKEELLRKRADLLKAESDLSKAKFRDGAYFIAADLGLGLPGLLMGRKALRNFRATHRNLMEGYKNYLSSQIDLIAVKTDWKAGYRPSQVQAILERDVALAGEQLQGHMIHVDAQAFYGNTPSELKLARSGESTVANTLTEADTWESWAAKVNTSQVADAQLLEADIKGASSDRAAFRTATAAEALNEADRLATLERIRPIESSGFLNELVTHFPAVASETGSLAKAQLRNVGRFALKGGTGLALAAVLVVPGHYMVVRMTETEMKNLQAEFRLRREAFKTEDALLINLREVFKRSALHVLDTETLEQRKVRMDKEWEELNPVAPVPPPAQPPSKPDSSDTSPNPNMNPKLFMGPVPLEDSSSEIPLGNLPMGAFNSDFIGDGFDPKMNQDFEGFFLDGFGDPSELPVLIPEAGPDTDSKPKPEPKPKAENKK